MQNDSIRVSAVFPVSPERIYEAWLDGEEHGAMTGSSAKAQPKVGAKHSSWDGYIVGVNKVLEPARRIVQTWYAGDFPGGSEHSLVEVLLEPDEDGTLVTIVHTEIPDGMGKTYELGWQDFYIAPMRNYFAEEANGEPRPAKKAAAAKPAAKKVAAKKASAAKPAAKKVAAKAAPAKAKVAVKKAVKKAAKKLAKKRG